MKPIIEWFVEVEGPESDLDRLVVLSCKPDWEVRRDGDTHFLLSSDFHLIREASEAHRTAIEQTFPQVLGMAKVLDSSHEFGDMQIGGRVLYFDACGRRQGNVLLSGKIVMSASSSMTAELSGGSATASPQKPLSELVTSLRTLPEVHDALVCFGAANKETWTYELYKAMEIITADIGEKDMLAANGTTPDSAKAMKRGRDLLQLKGWATNDEVEGFRAVHYPALTGRASRHAVEVRVPPAVPMASRQKATRYVRRIIEAWLREKDAT